MYKALIIGAGQIAGGYDDMTSDAILTHAHAYTSNPQTNLIGFYDKDYSKAEEMAFKWHTSVLKDLDELNQIDIISICTPDNCHLESIKEALKLKPKVIFLEKPIATNIEDEQEIIKISKDTSILVDFSRRFVREFQELARRIKTKDFGAYKTGTGYYGKGYRHNGSHMRDLLELLIGPITETQEISSFKDYSDTDLTKNVILKINDSPFIMQGVNCTDFTIFELDLIFEKGRIKILNSGSDIEIFKIENNDTLKDYSNLVLAEKYSTEVNIAMKNAVQNIVNHLKDTDELLVKPRIIR